MKVLLVYPKYPDSYWSLKHALQFISKKALFPPLGLITVSAMLPIDWSKRLVDMNIASLTEKDLNWADYVFISAMHIQQESVREVISLCKKAGTKIVVGGPLFTYDHDSFPDVDHFILNEAELTLGPFLDDLYSDQGPKRIYQSETYARLVSTPVPDYHLLNMKAYGSMNLQVSRGCPFACDFCEITTLLGHKVRIKETYQVINELETLYKLNWRGAVFVVDDNFIGKKKTIKTSLLPAMKTWMLEYQQPYTFNTQTSIDMADDEELMQQMLDAGFRSTFIGIETPDEDSLVACNKVQNNNRNLLNSVQKIQQAGFHVSAGFIVGFDNDLPSVFQRQIDFIQKSGIVSAMVGLLNAPKNTKLYQRLKSESRLTTEITGNNTDLYINFIPKMNYQDLVDGYNSIIHKIYSPKPYYQRVRQFLLNFKRHQLRSKNNEMPLIRAFFKSVFIIGIQNKGRLEYWKLLAWTLFRRPAYILDAMLYAAYGHHYRMVYGL